MRGLLRGARKLGRPRLPVMVHDDAQAEVTDDERSGHGAGDDEDSDHIPPRIYLRIFRVRRIAHHRRGFRVSLFRVVEV